MQRQLWGVILVYVPSGQLIAIPVVIGTMALGGMVISFGASAHKLYLIDLAVACFGMIVVSVNL